MDRRHFLQLCSASTLAPAALAAANSKPSLRVAVIGHTGRGNYGHGLDTMWLKHPAVQICAIADADATGLANAQARLKVQTGYADYREMLQQEKPDIVAVTPRHIEQHHDMILAACQAGAKAIYAEKPFCCDLVEADAIIAAATQSQTKIALAHRNRYHPVLPVIQQMIRHGKLGTVTEVRCRGKEDLRGGVQDLWVLGSHVLNLAVLFTGKPVSCQASLWQDQTLVNASHVRPGAEGIGPIAGNRLHARFDTESGIPIFFDSILNAGPKNSNFGLQILGTQGCIDLRIDEEPLAHFTAINLHFPTQEPIVWQALTTAGINQPEPTPHIGAAIGGHQAVIDDLIACIGTSRQPLCDAQQGRESIEMIFAILDSHRLQGQRVSFPLQTHRNPLTQLGA